MSSSGPAVLRSNFLNRTPSDKSVGVSSDNEDLGGSGRGGDGFLSHQQNNNKNGYHLSGSGVMVPMIRKKNRKSMKRKSFINAMKKDISGHTTIIIFLVTGLFFCLLDWLYIVHYMSTRLDNDSSMDIIIDGQHDDDAAKSKDGRDLVGSDKEKMDAILNDPDRAHVIQLLRDAKFDLTKLELEKLEQIPKMSQVTAMYGKGPVIAGLDTCDRFQNLTEPEEHFLAVAGTFNTGTNLLAELLKKNCYMPARVKKYGKKSKGVRWQVRWGKHTPIVNETFRLTNNVFNDSSMKPELWLPAVMVRDPLKWMQSMCRHQYNADWPHEKQHCPNLVYTNESNISRAWHKVKATGTGGVPLVVHYHKTLHTYHNSLVGFWNDWYRKYKSAKFPRIFVRFEDLIFYPRLVTQEVCKCAGGKLRSSTGHKKFQFVTESAKRGKAHGNASEKTTYLDALVKYGTERGRYDGYHQIDLDYAIKRLDPGLMRMFKYKPPPSAAENVAAED